MSYLVNYFDDDYHKHICVAKDMKEIEFLEDRFGLVKYETISDKMVKAVIPSANNTFEKIKNF